MKKARKFLKPKIYNLKSNLGFTLIEILVVMAIMVVMASILVGYTRQSGRQLILTSTEAKMLSLISRAKFLSIETFFQEESQNICGYGVHVDTNADEIFIFQDLTGGSCPGSNVYENGERLSGELSEVELNTNLFDMSGFSGDIMFVPPDPDVFVNGSEIGPGTEESLTVEAIDGSGDFTIAVNGFGQVRAE